MKPTQKTSLVRHILTFAAGLLFYNGAVDGNEAQELVSAALTLFSFGWSYVEKKKNDDGKK